MPVWKIDKRVLGFCSNWSSKIEWKRGRAKPHPSTISGLQGLAHIEKANREHSATPSLPLASVFLCLFGIPFPFYLNFYMQMRWWDSILGQWWTEIMTSKFPTGTNQQGAETELLVCVFESFLCQNATELYHLGKEYLKALLCKSCLLLFF